MGLASDSTASCSSSTSASRSARRRCRRRRPLPSSAVCVSTVSEAVRANPPLGKSTDDVTFTNDVRAWTEPPGPVPSWFRALINGPPTRPAGQLQLPVPVAMASRLTRTSHQLDTHTPHLGASFANADHAVATHRREPEAQNFIWCCSKGTISCSLWLLGSGTTCLTLRAGSFIGSPGS